MGFTLNFSLSRLVKTAIDGLEAEILTIKIFGKIPVSHLAVDIITSPLFALRVCWVSTLITIAYTYREGSPPTELLVTCLYIFILEGMYVYVYEGL